MTTRSRLGILTKSILKHLIAHPAAMAQVGPVWQIGAGRKSNHGFRESQVYAIMGKLDARPHISIKTKLRGTPASFFGLVPTYRREPMPAKLPIFKTERPARSYRWARRNDEWARKDVGNTKPADRQRLMSEGRA